MVIQGNVVMGISADLLIASRNRLSQSYKEDQAVKVTVDTIAFLIYENRRYHGNTLDSTGEIGDFNSALLCLLNFRNRYDAVPITLKHASGSQDQLIWLLYRKGGPRYEDPRALGEKIFRMYSLVNSRDSRLHVEKAQEARRQCGCGYLPGPAFTDQN